MPMPVRVLAGGLLTLAAAAAGADDMPIAGGKYTLGWAENVSVPVHPGYLDLPKALGGQMVITSFEATPFIGKNAVYLYNPADQGSAPQMLPGSDRLNWPNVGMGVDASAFGFPAIVVGAGFLVPSHATGGVWVFEASANPQHLKSPVKVTKDKSGWFYHLAVPVDMDGDGKLDLLTSRCEYGILPWSKKQGELLWLQQPKADAFSGEPWVEHSLTDGPDFLFCVQPGAKTVALVASEYIGAKMVYYYMRDGVMESRVLDANSGPGFSCSWEDLNGDGRLELLATNHLNKDGSVYAYSFDGDDFASAAVTRHMLATGFSAATTASGTASPGAAVAFRPSRNDNGKPHIVLSGDNSNSFFIIVPKSEDRDNWEYSTQKIAYLGADIGQPAVGDTDGDGFADIYIPAFDNNVLVHYKYGSAQSRAEIVV